jgi:hypothetical protein
MSVPVRNEGSSGKKMPAQIRAGINFVQKPGVSRLIARLETQ